MRRKEQLLRVDNPVLGLNTAAPEHSLPAKAWRVAHNVVFQHGSVKNAPGWVRYANAAAGDDTPVLLILPQSDSEGLERVIVATGKAFYELSASGTLTALTGGPFNADLDNRWQADTYANVIYAANIGDAIQKITPGGTAAAALANAPKARHLVQFEGHLLTGAVVTTAADYQALFGSGLAGVGDGFEDWDDADPLSDAYFNDIAEGGGPIMGLLRAGAYVLIQKETTSLLASYIKLPYVYSIQELPQKVGQLTPFAAADCSEAGVAFVSRNGFYRLDAGGGVTNIGERVARAWLADLIYADRARTYAAALKERREFILAYSSLAAGAGPFGRAMVWDWAEDAYSTRDWPFTAAGVAHVPRATLAQMKTMWQDLQMPWVQASDIINWLGDVDGNIFVYGNSDLKGDGTDLVATLESGLFNAGDASRVKLWRDVILRLPTLTGANPMMLSVGVTDSPETAVTWTTPQEVAASGRYFTGAVGRYAKLRLTKTGGQFALSGYDLSYETRGGY